MPSAKEIKSKMRGVRDTMKITKAMYMISTINMRKAKHQLEATEPYFYGLQQTMMKILKKFPNIKSEFFGDRYDDNDHLINEGKPKKVGYLVLSSDRGLAGAYNLNIFNVVEANIAGKTKDEYELFVVGELGRHYFAKSGVKIDTNFQYTVQKPTMHRARDIAATLLEQFENGELDEVYIVYTRMENSIQSEVEKVRLLPLERSSFNEMKMPLNVYREAIALYPSAQAVMDIIIPNYIVGMIYGCLVEAYASEHNARMTAMQTATDSAQDIIRELSIEYNRARQAAITQEITEVCSGANAQKRKRK